MDAGASLDPEQLPPVVGPVLAGQADLVLGRRRPTTGRAWPLAKAPVAGRVTTRLWCPASRFAEVHRTLGSGAGHAGVAGTAVARTEGVRV
jgi:hypothetical protein